MKHLGYIADSVPNGLAVLDALKDTCYDIILMDCQMPELDGYETTQRIRARRSSVPQPYIIALTAHARVRDRSEALLAGFQEHIPKPVDPAELIVAVARFAGKAPRD